MDANSDTADRTGVLRYVPSCLATLGIKPDSFLRQYGLTLSDIPIPHASLPYAQYARIFTEASIATNCPDFGLLSGLSGNFHTAGASQIKLATNARQALEAQCAQRSPYNRSAQLFLTSSGRSTSLRYVILDSDVESGDQISDAALAILHNIIRTACGPSWKADSVSLTRSEPNDTRYLKSLFNAPLRFDAPYASIDFPTMWLDKRLEIVSGHQPVHTPDTLRDSVVCSYYKRLLNGDAANSEIVASDLGMSRRTFHRRLALAGISFQNLVDQTRFGAARRLLRDTHLHVTEIALLMGYSDLSAFTRAFTHWHGIPPRQFAARRH